MDAIRQNARDVIAEARAAYVSPYEEWTSDELRELLVMYKIPIRDSANATHGMLVRICDEVFGVEVAESEREAIENRRLTLVDVVTMKRAASIIQKAYFRRKSLQRRDSLRKSSSSNSDSDFDYDGQYMDYEMDDVELGEDSALASMDYTLSTQSRRSFRKSEVDDIPPERFRHFSMLRRINEQGEDYDEEIDVEWRKPSWKFAKRHERLVRPHRAGKRMAPYDWKRVTLGRHCYAGGCGEQLDLWNEGRTSEFSQFGSGITNYFKASHWHNMFVHSLMVKRLTSSFLHRRSF